MFKKLGIFVLLSVLLAGCQTTSEVDRKKGKELSASECPVNLGTKISSQVSETSCKRLLWGNNQGYYYMGNWAWGENKNFSAIYYGPIKNDYYWLDKPEIKKENMFDWNYLKSVDLGSVSELECTGFKCYTFEDPSRTGTCLWFANLAKQGEKWADLTGATDKVDGFVCDERKSELYSLADAKDFLNGLVFKK